MIFGGKQPPAARSGESERMPAIFLAHGNPYSLEDAGWLGGLNAWAQAMPRPRAILMISAHWLDRPITLGAVGPTPLTYDFYGFPDRFYEVVYNSPGAPALANQVRRLLESHGERVIDAPERGLDHGAYVPLIGMYPQADVPVLQMSIPTLDPATLITLGQRLAPLRDEGVLIIGSGFLTHNLRLVEWGAVPATPAWAEEFDAWAAAAIAARDVDQLANYKRRAPGVELALPTHEHFVPMLAALGASLDSPDEVAFPITGFSLGSLSLRSVQFG